MHLCNISSRKVKDILLLKTKIPQDGDLESQARTYILVLGQIGYSVPDLCRTYTESVFFHLPLTESFCTINRHLVIKL